MYKLWNRLTSGSYFPLPVKEVAIKKKSGGERKPGIPTNLDRIAHGVVKTHLERIVEPHFHNSSFGYRPDKNCHEAVKQAVQNSFRHNWVIDLDINFFFDTIDQTLLMKAVKHFCNVEWVLMYKERWLKAGIVKQDGSYVDRLMVHLKLNEKKTQIVYCSDYERKEKHNKVQFDFPGFSYQSRKSKSKLYQNRSYTIFTPEISKGNATLSTQN